MKLLDNAGTGNGASFAIREYGNRNLDHMYTYFVEGAFGGATVRLEVSPDAVSWFDAGVAITAKAAQNVEFRAPHVRGVVVGGTAPAIDALLL